MIFAALVAGWIGGLGAAFAMIHRCLLGANSAGKVSQLTWIALAVTALPNWFIGYVVGGNLGGGLGATMADGLGVDHRPFVALGIFIGIFAYLFTTTVGLALFCTTTLRRLIS